MILGNLNLLVGQIFGVFAGFAALGLIIWFISRKKQNRIRLPTLRVLDFKRRKLPKFILRIPPLIPFFCFLVSALGVLFLALKPYALDDSSEKFGGSERLLIIDTSGSMQAHTDINQLKSLVREYYRKLDKKFNNYLYLSFNANPIKVDSVEHLDELLEDMAFSPFGLVMSDLVNHVFSQKKIWTEIVFFSDRDQYTWAGFRPKYYSEKSKLYHVDITKDSENLSNLYIKNIVKVDSGLLSGSISIKVNIGSSAFNGLRTGRLEFGVEEIFSEVKDFSIPNGSNHAEMVFVLPSEKLGLANQKKRAYARLIDVEQDAITLDNSRQYVLDHSVDSILVVGGFYGEMYLGSPVNAIESSFNALGMQVDTINRKKQDNLPNAVNSYDLDALLKNYRLTIVFGDHPDKLDEFCPSSKDLPGEQGLQPGNIQGESSKLSHIWLVPSSVTQSFDGICQCFHRIVFNDGDSGSPPVYCKNVRTQEEMSRILASQGGNKISGDIQDRSGGLAYEFLYGNNGKLLVYTMPLRPGEHSVFRYSQLPLFIKNLGTKMGAFSLTNNADLERTENGKNKDALQVDNYYKRILTEAKITKESFPNMPRGESILQKSTEDFLPQNRPGDGWQALQANAVNHTNEKRQKDYVYLIVYILLFALLIEIFYYIYSLFREKMGVPGSLSNSSPGNNSQNSSLNKISLSIIVLSCGYAMTQPAKAEVQINVIGSAKFDSDIKNLAREVSTRTSVTLADKIQFIRLEDLLVSPWIFSDISSELFTAKGEIKNEVVNWLYRGGFAVIMGYQSDEQIARLSAKISYDKYNNKGWMPIPPDHELMRSFYLLDALPVCSGRVWQGFIYDQRLVAIAAPYNILEVLQNPALFKSRCGYELAAEQQTRIFVNIIMVALTTNYKKDQVHLPEILKRLR